MSATDKKRALVVDDDPSTRSLLEEILERAGYQVEQAEDGYKALFVLRQASLQKRPFSVLLLDLMMPELDGFGFLDAIRKRQWGQGLPIVVLTARQQEESVLRAASYGVSSYLYKPVDEKLVLQKIEEATASV